MIDLIWRPLASSDTPAARRRRAVVHSALADESRLAVVDLLALGDLSPSALGVALGLRSNLLAHHLRVLEEAGIISRSRSEGDRRRTYIRILASDPVVADLAQLPRLTPPKRLLFVSTHDSARSQLATAIWGGLGDPARAASAGTSPSPRVHPEAVATARRHGLQLPGGGATAHIDDVLRPDDLVVAVCDAAHESLCHTSAAPELHWSVPDPATGGGVAAFESVYADLHDRLQRLATAMSVPTRRPESHPGLTVGPR